MYKVLQIQDQVEITILQQRWKNQVELLRQWGEANVLVCPGCRQPVRIRAGKVRRWHFAHKHLANCPLAGQSVELLTARALVYDWITAFTGEECVSIEKDIAGLPRPLDLWIETATTRFGVWIFDTRLAPELRQTLRTSLEGQGLRVLWLFTLTMLHEDELVPGRLHLTTTEREFLRTSALDAAAEASGEAAGQSLHYLDLQQERLLSFRRLHLEHPPQRYRGRKNEHPLAEIQWLLEAAEPLHPGEAELLKRFTREAAAGRERLRRQEAFLARVHPPQRRLGGDLERFSRSEEKAPAPSPEIVQEDHQTPPPPPPESGRQPFARQGVCIQCGKLTSDWVRFFGKTGECVCRACAENASEPGV